MRLLEDAHHAAWYAAYAASYDRPFDAPWLEAEKRVNLTDDAYGTKVAVAAWDGDTIVGGGAAVLPLQDNRELAYLDLWVHPDRRRHGHGSALLRALTEVARQHGRTGLFVEAAWGVDVDTDAGHDFLRAREFTVDLVDAIRQLDLPADVPEAPVADGYTLHAWRGPCPDAWVDQYADLRRRMNLEAPSGDVGLEAEHWDAERVRRDEADAERAGRDMQVTVARAADGTLAGHTQLSIPRSGTEAYQWDTLVLGAHRGQGLGLTLKADNMRAAADLLAGKTRILTYNAASNAPMIAVNELLGYRLVAWLAEHVREI